jgi:hypothetical protein
MNWHSEHVAHGDKRRANKSTKVDSMLAKYLRSGGRKLKDVELYQKTYGEKINARVNDEISKQGVEHGVEYRSDRMRIHREVVDKLWEEDKDKPEVKEAIDAAKSRQVEEKKVEKSEERIPEEYQK